MAIGTYGTGTYSTINISDIEIFYSFTSDRQNPVSEWFSLDPTEILTEFQLPTDQQLVGRENLLGGMYNLKLPSNIFNNNGFYNVYVRPLTIDLQILDCGVLNVNAGTTNVRGIVIDGNQIPSNLRNTNGLQGYIIRFINQDGSNLRNTTVIVTSSFSVSPISGNQGTSSQRTIRYNVDSSSSLIFLAVSPSSNSNISNNIIPFIGTAGQNIKLSNTNFSPVFIEIEMTNNDLDKVVNILSGNKLKDLNNGIISYIDENNNIISQTDNYIIVDDSTGSSQYEISKIRQTINNYDFNNITNI